MDDQTKTVDEEVAIAPIPSPEPEDLTKARDERCDSVAADVLRIIVKHSPDLSLTGHEKLYNAYAPIYEEVINLFLANNILLGDISYIFQTVLVPIDNLKQLVVKSTQESFETAQSKLFGSDSLDIPLRKIQDVLERDSK